MMQKWIRKRKRTKWSILQEQMVKTILNLATLKSYACLNMQRLREEHDKDMNATKENGETETIEELDKLHQIIEGKKRDVIKIGEEWDMIIEQLKAMKYSFNE